MYIGKKSFSVVEDGSSCSEIATCIFVRSFKQKSPQHLESVGGLYKIPFFYYKAVAVYVTVCVYVPAGFPKISEDDDFAAGMV